MNDAPEIMREGDIVQLTDPKGRHHTLVLEAGRSFHTHKGALAHDDLIGRPEGIVVASTGGTSYVALRSQLEDFVLAMPRGAAVIYPKEAARIVSRVVCNECQPDQSCGPEKTNTHHVPSKGSRESWGRFLFGHNINQLARSTSNARRDLVTSVPRGGLRRRVRLGKVGRLP